MVHLVRLVITNIMPNHQSNNTNTSSVSLTSVNQNTNIQVRNTANNQYDCYYY